VAWENWLRGDDALPDEAGRIAIMNFERWNIPGNETSGRSDSADVQANAGSHSSPGAKPGAILKDDGLYDEIKAGGTPIMVACTKVSPLRDAHIRSDCNLGQIINPAVLANPGMITDP
jgi:hypothetical protein